MAVSNLAPSRLKNYMGRAPPSLMGNNNKRKGVARELCCWNCFCPVFARPKSSIAGGANLISHLHGARGALRGGRS